MTGAQTLLVGRLNGRHCGNTLVHGKRRYKLSGVFPPRRDRMCGSKSGAASSPPRSYSTDRRGGDRAVNTTVHLPYTSRR
ncbi:hypothetical protein GS498_20140 [Rhodococcus hoagii]|nr:hypothetical protein [Prescottella equi]